ncbi:MAG: CapA family protein [Christensenellales bacterium]
MTSNNKYNRRHAARRRALLRRRALAAAGALAAIALLILGVNLIRGMGGGDKTDPVIQPAASATAAAATAAATPPETAETLAPEDTAATAPTAAPTPAQAAQADNGLRSAHIRVIGDIMFHKEQLEIAKKSDGTYSFYSQFQYIYESLQAADYTIANLETTVGKSEHLGYAGYPQFNTPESVLDTLRDCGIDFFTLANNHMLDRYFDGLIKNVDFMEEYGFHHVGAYRTQEERDTPVIYDVEGIQIGFVAYTHSTNTLENYSDKKATEFGVPHLYRSDIEGDIKKLRDAGAEVVIALPHWGTENVDTPDETQMKYARQLALAGADIILGNHAHMVQRIEFGKGTDNAGNEKEVFLIYSLGNFISSMSMRFTDCGIILDFTLQEQPDGTFRVRDVGYVPIYVWKQDKQLSVVPSGKYLNNRPEWMNNSQYTRMVESYHEVVNHLGTDGLKVLDE